MPTLNDVGIELVKVGEADTFQLVDGDKPSRPAGKFILRFKFNEKQTAGRFSLTPKLILEQISTNSATYQEVASYVVGGKKAYLDMIAFTSDTPGTAQWRITIKKATYIEDEKLQESLSLDQKELDLKTADEVLIEVKSDGATTIVADGIIQAREQS